MQIHRKTVSLPNADAKFVAEVLEVFADLTRNPGTAEEYLRMLSAEPIIAKCKELQPKFEVSHLIEIS